MKDQVQQWKQTGVKEWLWQSDRTMCCSSAGLCEYSSTRIQMSLNKRRKCNNKCDLEKKKVWVIIHSDFLIQGQAHIIVDAWWCLFRRKKECVRGSVGFPAPGSIGNVEVRHKQPVQTVTHYWVWFRTLEKHSSCYKFSTWSTGLVEQRVGGNLLLASENAPNWQQCLWLQTNRLAYSAVLKDNASAVYPCQDGYADNKLPAVWACLSCAQ